MMRLTLWMGILGLGMLALACGDDNDGAGTAADRVGVGAECSDDQDCLQLEEAPPTVCLQQFKAGYCGLAGCMGDEDCPNGSACVAHDDGQHYCFRICKEKVECNLNRHPDNESNCSSNVTFVENQKNIKACVPPSG